MLNGTIPYLTYMYVWESIDNLDINYWKWVLWVLYPIVISFLLPLVILLFFYGMALFLHVHNYRHRLREAYSQDFWDGARKTVSAFWDGQARIWHGYEIEGLDKIPKEGPALLIYYHGTIPIDFYYIIARCMLEKNRHIRAVGDNFLFHIPGWRLLMEVMRVTPGTIQSCVNVLKGGHLLGIAPGGVREALFGDEYYPVMWGNRNGFAKVAIQANVPIYPVFTQNLRESFRTPRIGRSWLRRLYEKTRLPIVPIYGIFPVKMKTFIGDPIYPKENMNPDELAKQKLQKSGAKSKQLVRNNRTLEGPSADAKVLATKKSMAEVRKVFKKGTTSAQFIGIGGMGGGMLGGVGSGGMLGGMLGGVGGGGPLRRMSPGAMIPSSSASDKLSTKESGITLEQINRLVEKGTARLPSV